ncbi:MAG: hypothetical protein DI539_28965 [Flavobacterium psychrophilum]|nr:MAG: hypothetical protein DI539_28965 [Flavobacterium psychrophilum]
MSNYNLTFYNKNFRFVYSPNSFISFQVDMQYNIINSDRFLVGAGQLGKYITEKNAQTVLKTAENMKVDKTKIEFGKYGKIEIYVK